MRTHETNGIVFILGNASEPGRERGLNDWLLEVHFAEVLAPGTFVHATRFENPAAKGDERSPRFATVYETNRDDPAAAWQENTAHNAELRRQGKITPISPYSATTMIAAFRRVAVHGDPTARTTGLFAVMIDVSGAEWPEFQQWYDDVHIPDIPGTGLYHAAVRYENDGPLEEGQPQYLTLYATGQDDPVAAQKQLEAALKGLRKAPRSFATKVRHWAPLVRLGGVAGAS